MNAPGTEPLHRPYWRLGSSGDGEEASGSLGRRIALAARPIRTVVRRAAPGAAATIVAAQLLGAVATALMLIVASDILSKLLEPGTASARLEAALVPLLLVAALFALRIGLDAASGIARAHLAPKARREAEQSLFAATLRIDLASFDDPSFYDQLQRARDRGILHLEGALTALVGTGSAALSVAAAAVALFYFHPLLPLILLLAGAPEAWGALAAARIQYGGMATTVSLTRQCEMMAELATQRSSAPEIRANEAEAYVLSEYAESAEALQDHLVGLGVREAKAVAIGRLLAAVGLAAAFAALAAMIAAGWLGLAAAGGAIIALRTAGASLSALVVTAHELLEKALYISDYQDFLDQARRRTPAATGSAAPSKPRAIRLDQVSFAYPGAGERLAVRNVSLTIAAGETVALVGENGSGKTTLAKLIAGLYRPTGGSISWDGVDLRDIAPASLADRIAMVLQEPIRWPRSARDNVRIGRHRRDDPGDVFLSQAALQSRAAEVVEQLPKGWHTLLSRQFRGGHDLSAGQWQRLAVARGLYRDAPLVIWDEPTAPLDAKAEHAVYESLRRLARDRTVVLITHRLASVRGADRIFLLDSGALAEEGTHEELLRLGGRYAELYELQLRLYG